MVRDDVVSAAQGAVMKYMYRIEDHEGGSTPQNRSRETLKGKTAMLLDIAIPLFASRVVFGVLASASSSDRDRDL